MATKTRPDGSKAITSASVSLRENEATKTDVQAAFENAHEVASDKVPWKERFASWGKTIGEKSRTAYSSFHDKIWTPAKDNVKEWGASVGTSLALGYAAYQSQRLRDKDAKLQRKIALNDDYVSSHTPSTIKEAATVEAPVSEVSVPEVVTPEAEPKTAKVVKVRVRSKASTPEISSTEATKEPVFAETAIGKNLIEKKRAAVQQSDAVVKMQYLQDIVSNLQSVMARVDSISKEDLQKLSETMKSVAEKPDADKTAQRAAAADAIVEKDPDDKDAELAAIG